MKIRQAGSHAARSSAGADHPKRCNPHGVIAPARIRFPLHKRPATPILPLQQIHVASDVLVLLSDTVTHLHLGGRRPLHRGWPTRRPPNKIRVDDVTRIPHQTTRPGRHLPVPARRSPVPDTARVQQMAGGHHRFPPRSEKMSGEFDQTTKVRAT